MIYCDMVSYDMTLYNVPFASDAQSKALEIPGVRPEPLPISRDDFPLEKGRWPNFLTRDSGLCGFLPRESAVSDKPMEPKHQIGWTKPFLKRIGNLQPLFLRFVGSFAI